MIEGEVYRPTRHETITCLRSGQSGGPFVFEVELAPGAKGPPTHTHDEGDEIVEVLEGEVVFRVNGVNKTLRAGQSLTLTPNDPHTFWNPSKTAAVRAKVSHGARFERLMVQPDLTSLLMYLCYVDPGASRATNPVVHLGARVVAWLGKLRAISVLPPDGAFVPAVQHQP